MTQFKHEREEIRFGFAQRTKTYGRREVGARIVRSEDTNPRTGEESYAASVYLVYGDDTWGSTGTFKKFPKTPTGLKLRERWIAIKVRQIRARQEKKFGVQ